MSAVTATGAVTSPRGRAMSARPSRLLTALAAAGTGTALLAAATPASAELDQNRVERVGGADRYDTAARLALDPLVLQQDFYDVDGSVVVLARGDSPFDALAASSFGLPVLLTRPGDLPGVTRQALETLPTSRVVVLGGPAGGLRRRRRRGGGPRGASRRSSGSSAPTATPPRRRSRHGVNPLAVPLDVTGEQTAVIASGVVAADALGAGSLVATSGFPLLLTRQASVPDETLAALDALDVERVLVLGGPSAVSEAVTDRLAQDYSVERLAGADRYETGGLVADRGVDLGVLDPSAPVLVRADTFPDALAAGPASLGRPFVLANPRQLPPASAAYVNGQADVITALGVVGGEAALPDDVVRSVEVLVDRGFSAVGDRTGTPEATRAEPVATGVVDVEFDEPVVAGDASRLTVQDADGQVVGQGVSVQQQNRTTLRVALSGPSAGAERVVDAGGLAVDQQSDRPVGSLPAAVALFGDATRQTASVAGPDLLRVLVTASDSGTADTDVDVTFQFDEPVTQQSPFSGPRLHTWFGGLQGVDPLVVQGVADDVPGDFICSYADGGRTVRCMLRDDAEDREALVFRLLNARYADVPRDTVGGGDDFENAESSAPVQLRVAATG